MYLLNEEALDVYDQFDKQICTKLNNLWQNGQSLKMKTAVSEEGKERHLVPPAGCDAVCDVQLYPSTAIPLLWASTPTHPKAVYGLSNNIVRGHVSDVLFLLAFYEHFTSFAENYSVNGMELQKVLCNFLKAI